MDNKCFERKKQTKITQLAVSGQFKFSNAGYYCWIHIISDYLKHREKHWPQRITRVFLTSILSAFSATSPVNLSDTLNELHAAFISIEKDTC